MVAETSETGKEYRIDPALWERFSNSSTRKDYCRNWLALQCVLIPGIVQGLVVLEVEGGGGFFPEAAWPEKNAAPERLADISSRVCEERCGLLEILEGREEAGTAPPAYGVAYPIFLDDRLLGAVAVEVRVRSEHRLKFVMEQLQWGVSWMELLFRREKAREDTAALGRLKSAVELMAGVLSEQTCTAASMAFVTEMATQLSCDRVSIAFIHNGNAGIQAISHSVQVKKRMNLVRAVSQAMDEAVIQRKEIVYPAPAEDSADILRNHKALSEQHGTGAILTVPVFGTEEYIGVMTFERPVELPFTETDVRFCRSVASLVLPVLDTKRREDRWLIRKIGDAFWRQLGKLFGPSYPGRKLLVTLLVLAAVFFSQKEGDYRIAADTVLEGAVRRVVVAPFDGYIKETRVRAGDRVENRALMCLLDDRELRLERLNWISRRAQYQRRYQEAIAQYNRAEANIIKAQLEQAGAQLELVENQIGRTRVLAPFNGIVVSDNLSQRLGGFVGKGEVLFEVTPVDAYRLVLEVDERRIADVREGQSGVMVLSALPTEPIEFVVEKITPITIPKEGLNYFRVEADLKKNFERLRPGMEGVGKIFVDRRNLFSIWTRGLREWLALKLWAYWP